jgi:hypothetical protein
MYDMNKKTVTYEGKRNMLEFDINEQAIQRVTLKVPKEKGLYKIEFDILTENVKWWNTTTECELEVF